MILRAASIAVAVLTALPVLAQTTPAPAVATSEVPHDVRAISDALLIPKVIDVIAREGAAHGDELAQSIFGDRPVPQDWTDMVAAIYDPDHMEQQVLASLADGLKGQDTAAMLSFLTAEPGRTLTAAELQAREAMIDKDVEEQAREAAAMAMFQNSPRLDLLRRYAEATDLIEMNVAGAMNNNVAYLTGLLDGGALAGDMTESDILSEVAAQEPQLRAQTEEWAYSFLLKAYEKASDADIEALIAFTETEPGQALNRAVFKAFDERFTDVSHALGLAAARFMTTEEI